MDINILVAAGILVLIALLIVRFAVKMAALFLLGGLILFIMGFGKSSPKDQPASTTSPDSDSDSNTTAPENAQAQPKAMVRAKAKASAITLPADYVKPDAIRIGLPNKTVPYQR